MDWDKLRVFHAVAEAGSFTHAGDTLNLSQSAVSRQISALEEALAGAAVPSPRPRPDPDRAGRVAEPHRARSVRQAGDHRGAADRKQGKARRAAESHHHGRLRLVLAGAAAARFLEAYPEVTVSLLLDDAELDLAMREADVAIRMHAPKQPDLVQRHLMTMQLA